MRDVDTLAASPRTRLTTAYDVRYPIAAAGMAFVGMTPDLAIAVCRAGGIGALGVGKLPPPAARAMVERIRAATAAPFNVNFITIFTEPAHIDLCIEMRVPIVSFHWGHPERSVIDRLHAAGIKVWEQVGGIDAGKRQTLRERTMGEVKALYRYPIKGLSAEPTGSLELCAAEGVAFDREFALALASTTFDEAAPEALAKTCFLMLMRNEELATLSTKVDAETGILVIRKDGQTLLEASVDDPAGRAAIADLFADYLGIDKPRLVRAAGHKFTDVSVVSPTMMRAVSVINLASVRALEQALGRTLDPLRFRANVYFDGLPAWSELDWEEKEVSIGPIRLRGTLRTRRCAATNVNPATALRDENLPAALLRHFGHPDMGIYLEVLSDGPVTLGDPVHALA